MKKMLFVYNPNAGRGEIKDNLSEIVEIFCRKDYSVTVYATSCSGDARNCVTQNGAGYDIVVCCGGDGTLNEVTDGLMTLEKRPPCGFIPAGTTNDFAHSFMLPDDMVEAAEVVCEGKAFSYDVGDLNGDYFDYIAGFGAFTEVSYATNRMAKTILGKLAYFLGGVKRISSVRTYDVEITIGDEVIEEKVIYGMVTNSFSVAGFLSLYKEEAKLNDGLFEVLLVRAPKNLIELKTIISALLSGDISCKHFIYRQISEIKVRCDEALSWTVDGEYGGTFFEADIKNHCKAIQFIRKETDGNIDIS